MMDSAQTTVEKMAVLMTCHNRRAKTLACLHSLFAQKLPLHLILTVYLVDDGSVDGTSEAVLHEFPQVRILKGNGSLYWCGGMRAAWAEAMKEDCDAYLWLNDDLVLLPRAVETLLETEREVRRVEGCAGIVVGSCRDPETGMHTYGGRIGRRRASRLPDRPMLPGQTMRRCETMNGNLVLVTRNAFNLLGNLSADYVHTFGDTDYGMRARKRAVPVWVAPGYQAECAANTRSRLWIDPNVPLTMRWADMCMPLGLPPRQWCTYVKRHTGWLWPLYLIKPWIRVALPRLWVHTKRR